MLFKTYATFMFQELSILGVGEVPVILIVSVSGIWEGIGWWGLVSVGRCCFEA